MVMPSFLISSIMPFTKTDLSTTIVFPVTVSPIVRIMSVADPITVF